MSIPKLRADYSTEHTTESVVEGIKIIENARLMSVFWIFVSCEGIFSLIQYWPTNTTDCISLSINFSHESCGLFVFIIYFIQPFLYVVLFLALIFINFDIIDNDEQAQIEIHVENKQDELIQLKLKDHQSSLKLFRIMSVYEDESLSDQNEVDLRDDVIHEEYLWELIKEKTSRCEELLFPICILKALILIEIFVVIYSPNLWYIIQIVTDLCRYLLWLIYTAIITKLKLEHKVTRSRTKLLNYVFLVMAIISLCIMTYEMLSKDLTFAELREHGVPELGFVQIIVESSLLLELINIVIENLLHIYCTCFHHSYHPIHDAPDISANLGNIKAICAFVLFGSSQIFLGTLKALQDDENNICSNFTLFLHEDISDCWGIFWIIQLCINLFCFALLMSQLHCNCHVVTGELFVFPVIVGLLMVLCEFVFAMTSGNVFYFIQICIDITGYIVLFVEGAYAYRFFMYIHAHSSWVALKRGIDDNVRWMSGGVNSSINIKLLLIFIGIVICMIAAVVGLVVNFYTDVDKIESSAAFLAMFSTNGDHERYEISVEQWMFLQIVFENTLLVEYIRLVAKSLDINLVLHED